MLEVLRGEGLTDLEFMAVTKPGPTWADHASGFELLDFPVMTDTAGVWYTYGGTDYDVFLVDKKGRLVTKESPFLSSLVDKLNNRIRQLHAE